MQVKQNSTKYKSKNLVSIKLQNVGNTGITSSERPTGRVTSAKMSEGVDVVNIDLTANRKALRGKPPSGQCLVDELI